MPLLFGMILGAPTCDVNASTIAYTHPTSLGLVGITSVTMVGNGTISAYQSSLGDYSSQTPTNNSTVESNGGIDLTGNATVDGNALPGIGRNVFMSGNASVTGSTTSLTTILDEPLPTLPSSYTDLGDISLSGNSTLTISAGTYYATGLKVSGNATLNITGAVTIYVNGSVSLTGNANVAQNLPENFSILVTSNDAVKLAGNGELDADVYAPQSDVTITGNGVFVGGAVGNTLSINGNGNIYDDLSGGGPPGQSHLTCTGDKST